MKKTEGRKEGNKENKALNTRAHTHTSLTIKSSQSRDKVKAPNFSINFFFLRLSRMIFSNFKGNLTYFRASRRRRIKMLGIREWEIGKKEQKHKSQSLS